MSDIGYCLFYQEQLDQLLILFICYNLFHNIKKCKSVIYNRKVNTIHFNYTINNERLKFIFYSKFKLSTIIYTICRKKFFSCLLILKVPNLNMHPQFGIQKQLPKNLHRHCTTKVFKISRPRRTYILL